MALIEENIWLSRSPRVARSRVRLFCFPYAGGGAAIFRRWDELLPAQIEVWALRLPGRELRIHEPPMTDMLDLVELIADTIAPYCDQPFALFGHSMGAGIAYETALELARRHREPMCLMPSARRAPHVPSRNPSRHLLTDEQFLEELRRLKGTPSEVLDSPELMELMLPVLRADFQLADLYVSERRTKLSCPVVAFGGANDAYVASADIGAWRDVSGPGFIMHMLSGDHFYINNEQRELTALVARELSCLPV